MNEDNNVYLYVYLDPRKPGNYEYLENGIGISFDFKPFYVGKGSWDRLHSQLREAKNLKNTFHRHNIIRDIWKQGLNPIIYKIFNNMIEQPALDLEECIVNLLGREDQGLGPLMNLSDGGGKPKNISEQSKISKSTKLKQLYKDNPQNRIQAIQKGQKTKKENPEIKIKQKEKEMETKRNNPEIMKQAIIEGQKTKKENPEIMKQSAIRTRETCSRRTEEEKQKLHNKLSSVRKERGIAKGINNNSYRYLDYEFLIREYFSITSQKLMIQKYKLEIDNTLSDNSFKKFYKILNFPMNTLFKSKKIKMNIYLNFVEENKGRIQWYIENYERLEKEFFDKEK